MTFTCIPTTLEDAKKEILSWRERYKRDKAERDDLKHQLKVAQEGWRCECSTDDACRFAKERDALAAKVKQMEAQEPFAYFYHDAANAQSANPLLHSTFFAHASDRRQHYRNETPLYLAPGVSYEAKDAEIASLKVALRTTIRTYVVDDDAWDVEAETDRFTERAIAAAEAQPAQPLELSDTWTQVVEALEIVLTCRPIGYETMTEMRESKIRSALAAANKKAGL